MTLTRDYKADDAPEEHVQYNITLPPKGTVQQKAPCGDNRSPNRKQGTIPTPEGANDIMTAFGESPKTFKRGHDGRLPLIGKDDNTPYRDGDTTLNRDEDLYLTLIEGQQNSLRIHW